MMVKLLTCSSISPALKMQQQLLEALNILILS